jgi:hypothetical protein
VAVSRKGQTDRRSKREEHYVAARCQGGTNGETLQFPVGPASRRCSVLSQVCLIVARPDASHPLDLNGFAGKSQSHQTGTQTAQPVGMSTAKASRGERDVTDADRRTLRELTETFERLLASGQAAIEQLRTITDKAA